MFACLACEWFWCSMNVNGFTHKPGRTGMVRLFPLVLTGALLIGMQPLQAAATKKLVLTPSEAQTFEAWTQFLAGGTQTWSTTHAPAFTPAIESTIWQVLKTDTEAQAISNPMIEYLEWRRSLDPTRFTSYHPNLSPALAQLLSSRSLPTNPPSPTAPQVLSNPATPSAAPKVFPPAVPEPSSLLLAAAMTGWGIWWRRRIAQRTAR
jgi:PEP-CTERM motif